MRFERALWRVTVVMVLFFVAGSSAYAMTLDEAIEKLKTHKFGQDDEALNFLRESAVRCHCDAELRKKLNDGLLRVLASDAAYDAKQFACRQLALTGTAEHIPVLAKHLIDERMSHMALYVLAHIESPEVDKVLLAALETAAGRAKLGIIHMLGTRRSTAAIKPLGKLAVSANRRIAVEAVKALGRIGTESALEQLGDYKRRIDSQALARAYLDCADGISADGKPERAWPIYLSVFRSSVPGHLRGAALKGLAQAQTQKAIPSILEALSPPQVRRRRNKALIQMATHLAAYIPGKDVTRILAGRLPQLEPNAQVTLLHALAVRGDRAALDAVMGACNSRDGAVRIAALVATGTLGDASTVRGLAEHAAKTRGTELEAARAALQALRGDNINSAMVEQLKNVDDGAKVELIMALAVRDAVETTPVLLKTAAGGTARVRAASYKALRNLAGADDVAALFDLLVSADQGDRAEAVKTIASVARSAAADSVRESASTMALKELGAAKDDGLRASVLTLLGDLGDSRALPALKSALEDSDKSIRDAAVRSLSGWPAAGPKGEPMDDLLRIARTSDNNVHRVLALRGYINLITTAGNLSPAQKVDACKTAMKLAEELSEKKRVLAKVAQINCIEALGMAESYLADQDLKAEASVAATTIAQDIYHQHLRPVRAVMQQVLRRRRIDVPSFVLDKARKIIGQIDAIKDYLTDWEVAGPYMQQGKECLQLFDIPFGPELPDVQVQWKPMPVSSLGTHPAYLDLLKELNGGEQRVAYLRTRIESQDQRNVRLEIYSDDGVKAWLNGKVIHANNCLRPIPSEPDTVNVTLNKGSNNLMLKVTQNNMPWGAIVLLREKI